MVIKIVGEEQVVCDCKGDTADLSTSSVGSWRRVSDPRVSSSADKYVDKLLVGIVGGVDRVTVTVFCPECGSSMKCEVTSRLVLESGPDS